MKNTISELLEIFTESAVIDSKTGAHLGSRRNSDIKGFWSDKGGIDYFTRGLEKFYPKLIHITIKNGHLKEIHQEDMKNYPYLIVLDLWKNEIEVLEDGLFAYNPDLVYLSFHTNKVCFIAPNIFNHLTKLNWLQFEQNDCIKINADDSLTTVKDLIKTINKNDCFCIGFMNQELRFEILSLESKTLDYKEYKKNLEYFEIEFQVSKYANFESLQNKLQSLKDDLQKRYQEIRLVSSTGVVQHKTCSALKSKLTQSMINMMDVMNEVSFDTKTCNPLFDNKLRTIVNALETEI